MSRAFGVVEIIIGSPMQILNVKFSCQYKESRPPLAPRTFDIRLEGRRFKTTSTVVLFLCTRNFTRHPLISSTCVKYGYLRHTVRRYPVMDNMQARSSGGSTPLMWTISLSAPSTHQPSPHSISMIVKVAIKLSQSCLFLGGGGDGEGIIAHFNQSKLIRIKGKPDLPLAIFTYLMSFFKFLYQVLAFSY